MLACRFKVPNVNFSFYVGTFVEHLPIPKPKGLLPYRYYISTKALSTAKTHNPSHFETLTSLQKDQVHLYVDALLQWNQRMNLTAVSEASEVMERHIEDSLAMIPPIRYSYTSHCNSSIENLNVVDVGTGAGLPGLVLAIAHPGWKVTLVESMKKRCVFLEHVVSVSGLSNVEIVRGRAEDLGQNAVFRETFDVAVARAVAEMRILVEYCLPLVRVGGLLIAAKGHDPQVEVKIAERSIQLMGASVLQLSTVESRSPYGQRTAVICAKDRPTPRKYPRSPGISSSLLLILMWFWLRGKLRSFDFRRMTEGEDFKLIVYRQVPVKSQDARKKQVKCISMVSPVHKSPLLQTLMLANAQTPKCAGRAWFAISMEVKVTIDVSDAGHITTTEHFSF